ncbi:jerky protein homolog-like [Bactrocera dorsalis]|uniref:Jerky protein homolog-like n=1 Tax=Bactrocera dorsalis TaxID=27457 RepID=A0ABM3JCN2_BACDO|nr:jerky protein homolog-like [Bactrocera dorsalis]
MVWPNQVSGIKKNARSIISHQAVGASKRKTLRKGEYPRMEKMLYKWFIAQRNKNCPVTGEMLKKKAMKLHADFKEKEGSFHASPGWLSGFKTRFGIRLLKVCGEKLSSDIQATDPFKHKLRNIIYELKLCEDQVYNADETGLFWKMLPDRTYVSQTEKTAPGRKAEKAGITFLACTNATGQHKVKPLIIGHAKKPRSFKAYDIPVDYRNSKNAWMTANIFREWFHHCFVPQKGLPAKAILLLDNAPCHPPEDELKTADGSIFVMYMPPNVTPLIQPMDQNVIRLTKLYYKKHLLLLAVGKDDITQFLKHLTLKDAVSFLMLAWNQLQANEKWKEVHDIQGLLQVVLPEEIYTEQDIEKWNSIQVDEEIDLDNYAMDTEESGDDSQGEGQIGNSIKATEAIKSFDIAIAWAEANTTDYAGILVLKSLREKAVQKSISEIKKQTSIRKFFQ